jgi:hypothetical protein
MRRTAILGSVVLMLVSINTNMLWCQAVTLLRASNAPSWGNSPRVIEEMRIGVLDGDDRYTFGSIVGVTVTPDGTLWVADAMLYKLRRYSASGVYLGDIGRRGEGPGEFSYLTGLRLTPDGTVIAWDPNLKRISRFRQDGSYLDAIHVRENRGILAGRDQYLEVDQAGNFYVGSPHFVDGLPTHVWIRIKPNGEVIDSVTRPRGQSQGHVYPIQTVSAISPLGYLVIGRTDRYEFSWMLPDGHRFRIERSAPSVEFQRGEHEEAQRLENHFAGRSGAAVRQVPSEKPPWAWFRVDPEGRLWVQRYAPGFTQPETLWEQELRERYENPQRMWRQPNVYDVIDPQGRFLGSLRFPGSSRPPADDQFRIIHAQGMYVWTVERGQFGEQYVIRYRIEPG